MAYGLSSARRALVVVCLLAVACLCLVSVVADSNEEIFLSVPDPQQARNHLEYYTALPHIAGSMRDFETANWTMNQWLSYGLEAWIEEEFIMLTYPLYRRVEITSPGDQVFVASMQEPWVEQDPTSNNTDSVPTFNGYGPSGNATAEVVYVNYCREEDFLLLVSEGVKIEGNIVLCRYGHVFRGIKSMLAQKYNAVGVLIYSDPIDDGFRRGEVYPEGPWRPIQGVQRGSVAFLSICPGDPSDLEACFGPDFDNSTSYIGRTMPSIPVLPLSWGDAQPILMGLGGKAANPGWHGAVPNVTYNVGPGPVTVRMQVEVSYNETTPIWNVVGRIKGQQEDRLVLIGNHRDAWVFGATDPSSGSSALMETARGFGELIKKGWKPQRTLMLLSWDAEEYGLVGSTIYGRKHQNDLATQAVAYINVDVGVSGPWFDASGTPSLIDLVVGVASDVPYPNNGTNDGVPSSIMDTWNTTWFSALGSGSDFTVFIDHIGIPCVDLGFTGLIGGIYHSIYDSMHWMDMFGDPHYTFHKGMAQVMGLAAMRLADAVVLPFNYAAYATQLTAYLDRVILVANEHNVTLETSSFQDALSSFLAMGQQIEKEKDTLLAATPGKLASDSDVMALNDRLMLAERKFISAEGLPGRPFYKHVLQAPGLYKGYEPDVLPGVIQGIEVYNATLAQEQLEQVGLCVRAVIYALQAPPPRPVNKPTSRPWLIPVIVVIGTLIAVAAGAAAFIRWRRNARVRYARV
eukprot:TRINITY_DN1739_c0_g1_i6.p1 TRINITY_DN1739_c0_g1~~TRINITY_DN1739_c0_g1_i6.p1  ORF type:complete len:755 (+),score=154.28 TRINITY_DN1739_c0_g1_i6:38-2266(+)